MFRKELIASSTVLCTEVYCNYHILRKYPLVLSTRYRYHKLANICSQYGNYVAAMDHLDHSATILVVDDDPRIRELLRSALETEGFDVREAGTSNELYTQLDETEIDLITMDVLLERENGLDLVRDIRHLSDIPIILVTGRIDLIDTVLGLELGADDYITKPFLMRELIARVRSVLRRSRTTNVQNAASHEPSTKPDNVETFCFGKWILNPAARELRYDDEKIVYLTTAEYDLLEIFLASAQRVLSRDHLMERLTGRDWNPNDRVIDNHVAQLRKKIEDKNGFEWIKTVRGAGYMFSSKVTRKAQA